MRLFVLTSTKYSLALLTELVREGLLSALLLPERDDEDLRFIRSWSTTQGLKVSTCRHDDFVSVLTGVLSTEAYDLVMVFGFPWKIPHSLLSVPKHGFFNVHFSVLPAYRGPMPVFWQLRNGEQQLGVTIHRMDKGFDTGDIACSQTVQAIPGETMGLCSARLGQVASRLVFDLVNAVQNGHLKLTPQNETEASYQARPGNDVLEIHWDKHDSNEIQQIVNAANPDFHGALTSIKGMPVRLLEVAPVEAPDYPGQEAGTVVYADANHGVFVICKDRKTIRLMVVQIPEGIVSGNKLFALGIRIGVSFGKNN